MAETVIPDAAVEAAARGMHAALYPTGIWDSRADHRLVYRERALAALEAAAPHMLLEVITTVEELDALPFETVIRDGDEHILERWGDLEDGGWVTVMVSSFIPRDQITLPATVIYRPTP